MTRLTEQDREWIKSIDPKSPGMALVTRLLGEIEALEKERDLAIRSAKAASDTARSWRDEAVKVQVGDLWHKGNCKLFHGGSCDCGAVVAAVVAVAEGREIPGEHDA